MKTLHVQLQTFLKFYLIIFSCIFGKLIKYITSIFYSEKFFCELGLTFNLTGMFLQAAHYSVTSLQYS